MIKRNLARIAVVAMMFSPIGLSACEDEGLSINVSEKQIESKMEGYFPLHKEALLGQLQLDLQQPDLILKDGSERAELVLQSKVTTAGSVWPGQIRLSFGLDYAADTGTFYLVEPRVEDMNMSGVPLQVSTGVTRYLLPVVQQYLTRVPVYTLKPQNSTGQKMARQTLKKVAIKDRNLKVTLGWVDKP